MVEDVRELGADLVSGVKIPSRDCDSTTADAAARTVLSLMLLLLVEVCESIWIEVFTIATLAFDPGGSWRGRDCCGVGSAVVGETHRGDGSGTTKEVVVFLGDALGGFEGC